MEATVKNNPSEALIVLLKRLKAKFTDYSIDGLKQHPDYPSLLAINHTLDQLQIDNLAIRATYEQLQNDFPKPLLVHTQDEGGTYKVIDQLNEEQVTFVDRKGKLQSQSKVDFLKSWSGVAVLVDEETKGEEKDYTINKAKAFFEKAVLPLLMFSLALLMVYIIYYTDNLTSTFDYLFLLTKLLGVAATIPLIIRLIDKENPFVKKLCHSGKMGSKSNCASILDSPAAYVFGVFSWSDIGFVYFSSLFLYVLLLPSHSILLVAGLAALAAPFTIYSIYYQWEVARAWCKLCLAVQAIFLVELALAFTFYNTHAYSPVPLESLLGLILIFGVTISFYSLLKPVLTQWKSYKAQIPRLNKIKYKQEVFEFLLNKSPRKDTSIISTMKISNTSGTNVITIVNNPLCGPCIKMHGRLFEKIPKWENVSLEEIFLTNDDENSLNYQIGERMLALTASNHLKAQEAIEGFYKEYSVNPEKWLQKYNITEDYKPKTKTILEEHLSWCRKNKISATPTILLNGHELPKEYTIEDLEFFLS